MQKVQGRGDDDEDRCRSTNLGRDSAIDDFFGNEAAVGEVSCAEKNLCSSDGDQKI